LSNLKVYPIFDYFPGKLMRGRNKAKLDCGHSPGLRLALFAKRLFRSSRKGHHIRVSSLVVIVSLFIAESISQAWQAGGNAHDNDSKNAPTATENPATLDEIWQKASANYDKQRAAILEEVNRQANDGPFRPVWESLATYQVPEWYRDAKFGIFIHWGVYAVPAFGSEWYPRRMYIKDSEEYKHHLSTYGPLTKFGYKDFIPMFKAEHYNPQAWARLFKESGARYVVPVFEHHDGFAMYDSGLSDWTSVRMGPHRDLAGDLADSVRAEGLHFGASSHRIEHDWFMDGGRNIPSDVNDPNFAAFYGPAHNHLSERHVSLLQDWTYVSPEFASDWLARDAEIVEKYHPEIVYFDYWIGHPALRFYLARFAAFYYNESVKRASLGIINFKIDAMPINSAVLDVERGRFSDIRPNYWQTDTSVSNKSWGYIQNDTFKSPDSILHQLIDIVSKNGNLLLSIGPRSDGTIPEEVQHVLLEIGSWLKLNGEAIYGTRAWRIYGEGPTKVVEGPMHDKDTQSYTAEDFRFTTKGKALYAIEMARPYGGEAVIHSLGLDALEGNQRVDAVFAVNSGASLNFQQQPDGLHIHLPAQAPGNYAYAYRIIFQD
jgi:alpha-L-fucosidase